MTQPLTTAGLRHVALFVRDLAACEYFYCNLIGMTVDWRPDDDNVYLTSGHDNFALHRAPEPFDLSKTQRLDHIGFMTHTAEDVDRWYEHLRTNHVFIKAPPRQHRDGTRSFYCLDPEGVTVQFIHCPNQTP